MKSTLNKNIAVAIALAVITLFFGILGALNFPLWGLGGSRTTVPEVAANNISVKDSGLIIQDTVVGTGAEVSAGAKVSVHYIGLLSDGTKFDSSVDRGQPFAFTLGAGQVIKGWDEGVVGMKVGGTRVLGIPPELAYGNRAIGPIPANSALFFQVQLLSVE